MNDFDGVDVIFVVIGVIITAQAPTLLIALPLALIGWGIHVFRRSKLASQWGDRITGDLRERGFPMLSAPKVGNQEIIQIQKEEIARPRSDGRNIPWSQRIIQPFDADEDSTALTVTDNKMAQITAKPVKVSTSDNMNKVLSLMPTKIRFDHPKLPNAPTPLSVLIGYDPMGKKWLWADFGVHGDKIDTIHAFIAGQTRSGKDSQIRFWFTQLVSNNSPEDVQFIIIDAKGEWITPSLRDSRHMYIPPVGGFNLKIEKGTTGRRQLRDLANESIEDALIDTIELLQKRADMFQQVGATNLQSYERKTGKKLPLLFVIVTDIGTNLNGILEDLVRFLVLKGGSLGVRAIISMQTASGEDTGWRGQIGLSMSGYQGQSSADKPNMGIPVAAMKYRPSELPSVDVPENRGLFVVRKGLDQYVVRGAYLPDDIFEQFCEDFLPKKSIKTSKELLMMLLEQNDNAIIAPVRDVMPKAILTVEQCQLVGRLAKQGLTVSQILTDHLKFTSGARYAEAKPHVEIIWRAVNRNRNRKEQKVLV